MKTITEIKDELAIAEGYDNFQHFFLTASKWDVSGFMFDVCELYANQFKTQ